MCNCPLCKRNKKFESLLNRYNFSSRDKEFLKELYSLLNNCEFDLDWVKAQIQNKELIYSSKATPSGQGRNNTPAKD